MKNCPCLHITKNNCRILSHVHYLNFEPVGCIKFLVTGNDCLGILQSRLGSVSRFRFPFALTSEAEFITDQVNYSSASMRDPLG